VLLLVACEREGTVSLWRAPKVGDKGSGGFEYTAKIVGPDGVTHTLTNQSEFTSEVLALDGDFTTRMRMMISRNGSTLDGVAKPGISGTFDLTETPSGLEVVHVGGPLTEHEQAFYTAIRRYYPGLRDGALQPGYTGIRFGWTANPRSP